METQLMNRARERALSSLITAILRSKNLPDGRLVVIGRSSDGNEIRFSDDRFHREFVVWANV